MDGREEMGAGRGVDGMDGWKVGGEGKGIRKKRGDVGLSLSGRVLFCLCCQRGMDGGGEKEKC